MFACGCNNGTIRKGLYLRLRLVRGSDNSSVAVLRLFRHSFYPILSLSSLRIFEKPDVFIFLESNGLYIPFTPYMETKKKHNHFSKKGVVGMSYFVRHKLGKKTNWDKFAHIFRDLGLSSWKVYFMNIFRQYRT